MSKEQLLIVNGTIINEGSSSIGSLLFVGDKIEKIFKEGEELPPLKRVIDATGKLIIPGVIDDQVHFREPGATHKGSIESESAAAVLGGETSYMDMPNNNPPATTVVSLEQKSKIAERDSYANYSFYLGATNENIQEIIKGGKKDICGVKVFMGSSTGNMLVDKIETLNQIFEKSPLLIATHCESEPIIRSNEAKAIKKWGREHIPMWEHPNIRSREACIESTKLALELALRYNSRLHILHISSAEEVQLIREAQKISDKISAECCIHFLLFDSSHYKKWGSKIKCNPAIKEKRDREALLAAVKEGVIKVVATDHAPHTVEEKSASYLEAPSGLPLIQHSLQAMLELSKEGHFSLEEVVDRLSHSPALLFNIEKRGFIKEGYFADIAIVNPQKSSLVTSNNIAYRCNWSPLEGREFSHSITHTFVNGVEVVSDCQLTGKKGGVKLYFKG